MELCVQENRGADVWREGEAAVNRKGRILEGKGIFTLVERKSWALELVWEGINSILCGCGTVQSP